MKKSLFSIAMIFATLSVFGGGLLTNTNQNVHFLRNPARGASTEIDAVYSNPAGLSFLKHDGLTLSLNNQSAFQTRTITTTFAPFAMNGGSDTKEYEGTTTAPFIPSLQAAYKWKDFVFSGSFAIVGGGGTLKYDKGLPSFETQVAMLPIMANGMLQEMGMPPTFNVSKYSLDQYLEGSSITYGIQWGASCKINDFFSAFVGGRVSIVENGYKGHLKNIQINPNIPIPPMNLSGENMIPATDFVNGLAASGAITQEKADELLGLVSDKEIDCKQSGFGVAPILGFNINYEKLNIGVKYEFNTRITLENKTKKDNTGLFPDKGKSEYDIPALATLGVSYKFFADKLIASAGFHLFFDKDAEMTNGRQKELKSNSYEVLAGLEYKICDKFLVSAGGQISRYGFADNYQSDMNFGCNSASVGLGGAYNITEKLTLNLAYLLTVYDEYTKNNPYGPGSKESYNRTNNAFGIGLDYRF